MPLPSLSADQEMIRWLLVVTVFSALTLSMSYRKPTIKSVPLTHS